MNPQPNQPAHLPTYIGRNYMYVVPHYSIYSLTTYLGTPTPPTQPTVKVVTYVPSIISYIHNIHVVSFYELSTYSKLNYPTTYLTT